MGLHEHVICDHCGNRADVPKPQSEGRIHPFRQRLTGVLPGWVSLTVTPVINGLYRSPSYGPSGHQKVACSQECAAALFASLFAVAIDPKKAIKEMMEEMALATGVPLGDDEWPPEGFPTPPSPPKPPQKPD